MKIWVFKERSDDNEAFQIDFNPQIVVNTPNLYLLLYTLDTYRYLSDNINSRTPSFKEFHITRLHHTIYGQFKYDDQLYDAQVGCYLRKNGVQGFENILLSNYPIDKFFQGAGLEPDISKREILIIDFDDFNKARNLVGHESLSFKEYLTKRLTRFMNENNGLTIFDETSLFNVVNDSLNADNFITSKGLEFFFDEVFKDSLK